MPHGGALGGVLQHAHHAQACERWRRPCQVYHGELRSACSLLHVRRARQPLLKMYMPSCAPNCRPC